MNVKLTLILAGWLFFAPPVIAKAATPITVSAIKAAAEAAVREKISAEVGAQIEVEAQSLDNRVHLPRCQSTLSASLASDRAISRNNTVKVSCISPDLDFPWQMFVSVKADILYPVIVAARPLANGELLSMDNISQKYVNKTQLRGQQFAAPAALIGSRVKRRIAQDAPIYAANLCFVCKGDTVTLYAKTEAVTLKIQALAMSNGVTGERVKVKNMSSNKVLDVTVTGVGEVTIKL